MSCPDYYSIHILLADDQASYKIELGQHLHSDRDDMKAPNWKPLSSADI